MKPRKMSFFVITITISVLLAPQFVAALDVNACRIKRIGVMDSATSPIANAPILVQLIDTRSGAPTWPNGVEGIERQFYLHPDLGNAGYATLLTAYTLGKTVWVRIADPGTGGSLILVVLIND
jgi:hypothetical protein